MEEKKRNKLGIILIICMLALIISNIGIMFTTLFMSGAFKKENDEKAVNTVTQTKTYSLDELAELIAGLEGNAYDAGYNDFKEILKEKVESGRGVNTAIREILNDHIFYIYDGEYIFKPINKELTLNTLKPENFIVNNKDLSTYTIDYKDIKNDFEAYKGIDVSKFQGDIEWDKVADSGVDFSFVRVGYRGYETGKIVEDEKCKYNIENSLKNDIKTGVYFYTQAINVDEAIEEAEFVLDIVKDYDINYPIAFDLEVVGEATARTNTLTTEERIDIVKAFCDTVKEAGYTPMLYGNLATMFSMVEYEEVLDYEKWFAYYDVELYFPYDLAIWQYSCTGSVDGIEGDCDLNIAFKDLSTK